MINRKKIREYIACAELGDDHYGKWGILNLEQRKTIFNLLKVLDSGDCVIENLTFENQQLKSTLEEIREYIKSNYDFYYGDELYSEYEHILQIIDKSTEEK
jgi:hypothetical protein